MTQQPGWPTDPQQGGPVFNPTSYPTSPSTPPPPPEGGGYGYPPAGYGAPGFPAYGYAPPPEHPQATLAMVLGIVGLGGLATCGLLLLVSPFAWWISHRAKREIDQSGGRVGGRDKAQAGLVLGIIGTVLLALAVAACIVLVALFAVGAHEVSTDTGSTDSAGAALASALSL